METPIIAPRTPPSTIKPPQPEPASETKPVAKQNPPGWHSFTAQGIRGPVLESVGKSDLPDHIKAYLTARIGAIDSTLNFISVDFHTTRHGGKDTGHDTVSGKKVLVG